MNFYSSNNFAINLRILVVNPWSKPLHSLSFTVFNMKPTSKWKYFSLQHSFSFALFPRPSQMFVSWFDQCAHKFLKIFLSTSFMNNNFCFPFGWTSVKWKKNSHLIEGTENSRREIWKLSTGNLREA